jgi:hypothetical protein
MSNPNLVIIVEGKSEVNGLKSLLKQFFCQRKILIEILIIGYRTKQSGGTKPFSTLVSDISDIAEKYRGVYISTCFDYYQLSNDWPGVVEIKKMEINHSLKANKIEESILNNITNSVNQQVLWKDHFIPHIQLHEFETLFFASPDILASQLIPKGKGNRTDLNKHFKEILLDHNNNCENINDRYETCPSRLIQKVASYKKGDANQIPEILSAIGLEKIREKCQHFDSWIKKLENISNY